MRFENSELRAFRAVIEESGFKRAAETLHVSQSAVSQSVANLENKLDTPLIRRGKELRLTDAGKRVFEHAVDVLRDEQATLEDIVQLKQGKTEILSLAMSAPINRFYGEKIISAYYQQNPHSRMKISEMPSRSIISAVLSGSVELGLGPFQKHMPAFDTVSLYSESRYLVVGPKHPRFSTLLRGDVRDLQQTPLIASALDDPDMRPAVQRLRDQFSTVWEVSSLSLRVYMVQQGMGVTFVDRKLLKEHPLCADFRIVDDILFGRIDRQVGLFFRSGKSLSDSGKQLIALCQCRWNTWSDKGE
ncbi:MAG: LysR family transcriptional regulator [Halieaceae bacterium]|jgi:DNA-binding transcriptional LysR family regulator|nr:LysR family transcriptional regulator [Halieaceae bacterium]